MMLLTVATVKGQITIGGNVYGGGNEGKVHGNTTVTVYAGDLNAVFGGARMADVGGRAFVHLDGEHASDNIVITSVYAGNDIAGTVGSDPNNDPIPSELTEVLGENETKENSPQKNAIDNSWNAYIRTSPTPETAQASDRKNIIVGSMFGGGNGDYYYRNEDDVHKIYMTQSDYDNDQNAIASNSTGFTVPDLGKTYLEILGGCIAHLYGGGNNATVTSNTTISINNNSPVLTQTFVWPSDPTSTEGQAQLVALAERMKLSTFQSDMSSYAFNFARVFGGNNKATMDIRPVWNLSDGIIRDLYSGGNQGDMIYENGLFLEIPTYSQVEVNNVYGGCRMADVNPKKKNASGEYVQVDNVSSDDIPVYKFPANLAARVMIAGGDINNVYGGNDIRGRVYFGNAIGIRTSIRGNVYGGGNGAYAYTDISQEDEEDDIYSDFRYSQGDYSSLTEALNALRPNAEQVSIFMEGTEDTPTIIKGSVYVGGNCASLITDPIHANLPKYPLTELKMGSHVIAENVFLGNNGEKMVSEDILSLYANGQYSTLDLTNKETFSSYMEGVTLAQVPSLVVADQSKGDRVTYQPYTSYIGSLYYGGNRGSMTYSGPNNITPSAPIYIYNKLVAGCNNANVAETQYNARYEGGILGSFSDGEFTKKGEPTYTDEGGNIKDRIVMNLSKIRLRPMRLNSEGTGLEWNTVFKTSYIAVADGTTLTAGNKYYTSDKGDGEFTAEGTELANDSYHYYEKIEGKTDVGTGEGSEYVVTAQDVARRLVGANIYGGCCESGHVNGNVLINLNGTLVEKDIVFANIDRKAGDNDEILYNYELSDYKINKRNSGVILNEQGMDVLGEALSVFGGGKGKETEIWGSATVNMNRGYTFQVFGGSEEGVIGKHMVDSYGSLETTTDPDGTYTGDIYAYNGMKYQKNEKYSTYVNLNGTVAGVSRNDNSSEDIPDVEFVYGGGFQGPIMGNTTSHLDNGRLFQLFAGSCDADILGYSEAYVGLNGFPYLRDCVYGGNDFGGEIKGIKDFHELVRNYDQTKTMIHGYNASQPNVVPNVLKANAYVEYRQGHVLEIYGGHSGNYDYDGEYSGYTPPTLHNAFVNFRPDANAKNYVDRVFGGGEGYPGFRGGDKMQDCSYVLVDIPENKDNYAGTEVFGAGSNNGLGMRYTADETFASGFDLDDASAIVDLLHGQIAAVYGGAFNEGVTRRTVVNVPDGSNISIGNIFGGAYGTNALPPCDVYESNVNYSSDDAVVSGAIYGGNNNVRRTIYGKVNINAPVWMDKDKTSLGTVYGAGLGAYTWSEYTEVNLNAGAKVYYVFGGGQQGQVLTAESVQQYMLGYMSPANKDALPDHIHDAHTAEEVTEYYNHWSELWKDAWTLSDYFEVKDDSDYGKYAANTRTNLANDFTVRTAEMDERDFSGITPEEKEKKQYRYNTNVIINEGATVAGYAFGGGLGGGNTAGSGDVIGTTYVAVLGGTVEKDVYGAGRIGKVQNAYGGDFIASANAYIEGGTARNVYGGGYEGHVGKHDGAISTPYSSDVLAETHVVIGKEGATTFSTGVPAITRNVYGGGEGGSVYGSTHVKVNNGYIGYRYKNTAGEGDAAQYEYVEELDDNGKSIDLSGNVFGGGYVVNSFVDQTSLEMYGGTVRGSLYGGGEIGPVGRGTMKNPTSYSTGLLNNNARIFKAGHTHVKLYDGWVKRNVFGGGRGMDSWGGDGTMYMDKELLATLDLDCMGFVFGQTEVDIFGGEVGTEAGTVLGYGNVFGGGDIGFVYSAYEKENVYFTQEEIDAASEGDPAYGKTTSDVKTLGLCVGMKPQGSVRYDGNEEGYYYKFEYGSFVTSGSKKVLTEDCKVLVEPWCKTNANITLNGKTFKAGEFVPTAYLDYLGNKTDDRWNTLSKTNVNKNGIIIHNAVFAGGNTSSGSTEVYASTTTVYGNATASIRDVYHRDLITIGTGHTGGLYGEGNLTLVDGYRELNITNYGTDYYSISSEISQEQYESLPLRERAYYEPRFKCITSCQDRNEKYYGKGSTITADEMMTVFEDVTVDPLIPDIDETTGQQKTDKDGYPIYKKDPTATGKVPMLTAGNTPRPEYWVQNGVCSRYAGRIMNTIQRADFCGVFGSRMVMQGARDRVPATVDYTNYTINRVREVSLNKKASVRTTEDAKSITDPDYWRVTKHGNYFGIYNIVNFLGALTSDLDFGDETTDLTSLSDASDDIRTSDNIDTDTYQSTAGENGTGKAYGEASFYDWKKAFHDQRKRNNGNSYNKVALASGVYLELTTEKGADKSGGLYEKDWGIITGVVELDLINVQTGLGGGFVYAKNIHGVRSESSNTQVTLTDLNDDAVSLKHYSYAPEDVNKKEWQTSGNFVHSTQTIIDDCYNIGNRYKGSVNSDGSGAMPVHYWYIKGSVYVYDQYISAYTGQPNAYSEVVNIPLTITSASHGKLTLLDVKPNRYAYYSGTDKTGNVNNKLSPDGELVLRDITYKLNDPIDYWEWYKLSNEEKKLFVEKTYVTTDSCKIGDTFYPEGYVMLPKEYGTLRTASATVDPENPGEYVYNVQAATIDADGNPVVETDKAGNPIYKSFDDVFHESNNLSHDTGYILTFNINNPTQWNTWYSPKNGSSQNDKIDTDTYGDTGTVTANYWDGPTYTPTVSGVYGQMDYTVGNIISETIYNSLTTAQKTELVTAYENESDPDKKAEMKQASFERAYLVKTNILETTKTENAGQENEKNTPQRLYKGAALAKSDYKDTEWDRIKDDVAEAFVVTNTIQLNSTDYIYLNTYLTQSDIDDYVSAYSSLTGDIIADNIAPAYYCTEPGKYGGDYYEAGHNYRATASFIGMSDTDRSNFTFNYDALDLLIDPTYSKPEGQKYQYDSSAGTKQAAGDNKATYSLPTSIDYKATYKGTSLTYTYKGSTKTIQENDVIDNKEFESLLNEKYYYAPINVQQVKVGGDGTDQNDPYHYYVLKKTMIIGDTPYAAGQVIDKSTYDILNNLLDTNETIDDYVDDLTFGESDKGQTYYYCREGYTIAPAGTESAPNGIAVTDLLSGDTPKTYNPGEAVPVGVLINSTNFGNLTNKQTNFVIHGLAPTETSTLYVVRNSDIDDLTTEKIITVIYEYDYVESDTKSMSVTPVSERHILNIHINFKSGVPTVEDIKAPTIVLPGTTVTLKDPFVTPGAYEVTGGGWELFDNESDAESHMNGIPYTPKDDPLYLYQDQYLVAYYAKTYLGKTYSNAVPVSVANFHDLKKVMGDTDHHYYIDHKDVIDKHIEPKIYINDYRKVDENGVETSESKNGLDLLKNLFDLSLLTSTSTGVSNGKATIGGQSHALLDNTRVGGCEHLQFFLNTDIDHGQTWTPIGDATNCFEGTLHGDGHTITGLDNSLFKNLCGNVYNLGVIGSFTGAGVVDTGTGYVENCWINTTGNPNGSVYAVFGNPTATAGVKQVVNSYYQTGKTYKTDPICDHGMAIAKPDKAFYNGEVAYDLNGFYLYKRYNDNAKPGGSVTYQYWVSDNDQPQNGSYAENIALCSSGYNEHKYVEDRFADGDFIYVGDGLGTIPDEEDERLYTYTGSDGKLKRTWYPIWPDDYLFFGQKLNYGWVDGMTHQNTPSSIIRSNGRVAANENGNRVYRAPAYFRNNTMDVAHFNPYAVFAKSKKGDASVIAYQDMTAIDFTGDNGDVAGGYQLGLQGTKFYPPLLDDDGLYRFRNADLTKNLLVYTADTGANETAGEKTATVVRDYLLDWEPVYTESTDGYRTVASQSVSDIKGHWVSNGIAKSDHLLVDKEDFDAPIAYTFDKGRRMWYQREPAYDEFVDRTKGWQAISLPFTAELVTTNQKGEITHFYSGSEESKNNTRSKIGHEYWLRELNADSELKQLTGENNVVVPGVLTAGFTYPTSQFSDDEKTVTNTFLWDYYYRGLAGGHNQKDYNKDTYQEYYSESRTYGNYPLLAAGTPYLLGLPGVTYYEFDLSGNFDSGTTTDTKPEELKTISKQTITFASVPGTTIAVSESQKTGVKKSVTISSGSTSVTTDYFFKPNYLNWDFEAGSDVYTLVSQYDSTDDGEDNPDCSSFVKVPATGDAITPVKAFRPFFISSASTSTRNIVFGNDQSEEKGIMEHGDPKEEELNGGLIIWSKKDKIYVQSSLSFTEDLRVVTPAGITVATFTVKPGQTVEVQADFSGMYVVHTLDGLYTKKVVVKRE